MRLNRRQFLGSAAAGAVRSLNATPSKPNVIIILTDDQGYGDFSCYGNPRLRTPNLDRLHAESVRFTDFHVTPMCAPTRAQLMTGRDALATGASNPSSGRGLLRRDLPTMAEIFAASGYRTGLFGKWNLGDTWPYRPQDRGFEEAIWFPSTHIGSLPDAWNNDYFNDRYRHGDKLEQFSGYCADVFFREAMDWMQETAEQRVPFFVYLPLNTPHKPFFVPESYRLPYNDLPPAVTSFYGMIANIDENVGRLEKMLRRSGLRDNTILIFMTDNGTVAGHEQFNSGMRGHKVQLWEGGHRVPCLVRWPAGNLRSPGDVAGLTHCQDVLPTLIDLCGLRAPAGVRFDGVSLAPIMRKEATSLEDRILVVQYCPVQVRAGVIGESIIPAGPREGHAAVLWRHWRLIEGDKLYDLRNDPAQKNNVIDDHRDVAMRLRKHYHAWWRAVEPQTRSLLPTYIGAVAENPVFVSPCEWEGVWMDQCLQVRKGERRNGTWHIHVERSGDYEFQLRRWPKSVDVPLSRGVPPHSGEIGKYPAGVALPIAKARIQAGGHDESKTVGQKDAVAAFHLRLAQGSTRLKTWFYDSEGSEICGAYYVTARRL